MSSANDRPADSFSQVFRPSTDHILRRVSPLIFGALAVIYLFPVYRKLTEWWQVNPFAAIGLIGVSVGLLMALIWAAIRISRRASELVVEPNQITYHSFVRTRSWPRNELARLVQGNVLVQLMQSPSYSSQQLLFINSFGRCFLRLGPQWQHSALSHALGLTIEPTQPDVVTAGDAAKVYPGSYDWITAHPGGRYLVSLALAFVLIAVSVTAVAVFGGRH